MSRTQAELVFGKGAHTDALSSASRARRERLAGTKPPGAPYSVYGLVWHMSFWMENELERIDGEARRPIPPTLPRVGPTTLRRTRNAGARPWRGSRRRSIASRHLAEKPRRRFAAGPCP